MPEIIQRSFVSGEIAPALGARADIVKYTTGLSDCTNMIVRSQGGVYSRPGLRFIGELDDSARKSRLVPFSFNTEQTYILVFEHLKVRFIRDGGYVLSGGVGSAPVEVATPYTEDQLFEIQFAQSADVLTLVHRSHDPRNLNRLSDTSWTLEVISYASTIQPPTLAPTYVEVGTGGTVTPTTTTLAFSSSTQFLPGDIVTLTGGVDVPASITGRDANVTFVRDDQINDIYEIRVDIGDTGDSGPFTGAVTVTRATTQPVGEGAGDHNKTYRYIITAVNSEGEESLPSAEVSQTTGSLSVTHGIRLAWNAVAGAVRYRVYKDLAGDSGVFGWIGDSTTRNFTDFNIAPLSSDTPPAGRLPFDGVGNKPGAVTYYQQRQVFANTTAEPQTVYTTQTGNFASFRTSSPARDDDAITFTIAAQQVNEIRHLIPLDTLVILTSGAEWRLTEGDRQVFTPATAGVRVQSYNGASTVPPAVVNDSVLYLQEKGSKLRDLDYNFSNDRYGGNDLSIMSEHLFEGHQITQMAYSEVPYGVLWCIRDDGVLLGLTYQKEHQVWGWHKHITDGEFESVAVIAEGDRDAAYFTVKRTVSGQTRRYVERMEPRDLTSVPDLFCVDSGLTYNGAATSAVSGLDHLEGKVVAVLADGFVESPKTVVNGTVQLDGPSTKVQIGLPYTARIQTLDIDPVSMADPLKAKNISIAETNIFVEKSRGLWVGPVGNSGQFVSVEREGRAVDDLNAPAPLETTTIRQRIPAEWSNGGRIQIEQRDPLPLAILAVSPSVSVGG